MALFFINLHHYTGITTKNGENAFFCLPAGRNSGRADSKVDKKWGKCLFFVYWTLQIRPARSRKQTKNGINASFLSTADSKSGPRGLESITKSSKIEKIFYSVPSSKRPSCSQCSQSDSKTDKTRQKTMPKLSLRPQTRKPQ